MTFKRNTAVESTPTPAPIKPEYLTTEEAAELLLVSPRVIGQYVATKGLKASRIGKRLIIMRHDLDQFVSSRVVTGTAA
jgi:excisionase family DNA binding protein